MRLLSRIEEIILHAIWRLQDNAYGITIREEVFRTTGKTWLTGAIYASLSRMLEQGLVVSYEGKPTKERGGRRKVLYCLTDEGKKALLEIKRINAVVWEGFSSFEVQE
jgi:DNA-binding PadR family transcriptional regulator